MDRVPVIAVVRDHPDFPALRAKVAARARVVSDAWRGPPEELSASLTV
jgi:hypothetical protein